jgi:hypothetical protein
MFPLFGESSGHADAFVLIGTTPPGILIVVEKAFIDNSLVVGINLAQP